MLPIPVPAQSITQRSKSHHQGDNRFCLCISVSVLIWILFQEQLMVKQFSYVAKTKSDWHYLAITLQYCACVFLITDKHTDWWQQMLFSLCYPLLLFLPYSVNQPYLNIQTKINLNSTNRISPSALFKAEYAVNTLCFFADTWQCIRIRGHGSLTSKQLSEQHKKWSGGYKKSGYN